MGWSRPTPTAMCRQEHWRGWRSLLIESQRDNVVPHPVIENYLSACVHARSLTYRVLEGADHSLSEEPWRSAYTTLLVSWLNEMTVGLREPR